MPDGVGHYAFGDPRKRPLTATPIGPPLLFRDMPIGTRTSDQLWLLAMHADTPYETLNHPNDSIGVCFGDANYGLANAVILGTHLRPMSGWRSSYDVLIQYCSIPASQWRRARAIPYPEEGLPIKHWG